MLQQFCSVWQARRVTLIGSSDAVSTLRAFMTILGARCLCLPADASQESLCQALTAGRTFAFIVCGAPVKDMWLLEAREAGVPLTLLCPDGDAQDAALCALRFGVRFAEDGLPCGVYDLNHFS